MVDLGILDWIVGDDDDGILTAVVDPRRGVIKPLSDAEARNLSAQRQAAFISLAQQLQANDDDYDYTDSLANKRDDDDLESGIKRGTPAWQ